MIHLKFKRGAVLALASTICLITAVVPAAPNADPSAAPAPETFKPVVPDTMAPEIQMLPGTKAPETFKPLVPGPIDPSIAYWTARFLQELQYSQQLLDAGMSEKFFDGYLETLDPRRESFLQSDIDEFAHYRTNLDAYTLGGRDRADLTPAYQIFERFVERTAQHIDYVNQLLKQDHFKFDANERFALDRHTAPYPKDLAAAEALWSQRLRYEYLIEKMDREFSPTNGGMILPLPKSADAEITAELARRYNWLLRTITNYDSGNVLQFYLNALTHAYDPHSDYFNHEHEQNFQIEMSLSLGGIGAQLTEDDGYCTVTALIPGGPADQSKQIKPKDRIVAVAQSNQPPVKVVDMDLSKVVELIRGPKGTQVRLTLEEKDVPASRHEVALTRDEIKIKDQEAKAKLIEFPGGQGETNRIGVISVPSFYAPIGSDAHSFISEDTARLLKKLEAEKVGGIILDMRGNPGGSLEEAIKFTGLFIKSGPVVLARSYAGQVDTDVVSNSAALYSGPLVVLINRFSASAAEIAAAALQDYGRALVVGDISTHGKGTVQSLIRLESRMPLHNFILPATSAATNDPGELKVTVRKFYRVTGATTQMRGVEPDLVLPDVLNYNKDIGETNLENALPGTPLPPEAVVRVHYDKFNLVQPYIADLRRLSDARIATNQDFAYVRQDIAQYQLQADKTAPMNEQEAIRQRQADIARDLARKADWAARPVPNETIYGITVENSVTNGLPVPDSLSVTNVNVRLTFTNKNGSVSFMTTNNDFGVGMVLNQFVTNTPAGRQNWGTVVTRPQPDLMLQSHGHSALPGTVVTQPTPDWMLIETKNILMDYIPMLSKSTSLTANQ